MIRTFIVIAFLLVVLANASELVHQTVVLDPGSKCAKILPLPIDGTSNSDPHGSCSFKPEHVYILSDNAGDSSTSAEEVCSSFEDTDGYIAPLAAVKQAIAIIFGSTRSCRDIANDLNTVVPVKSKQAGFIARWDCGSDMQAKPHLAVIKGAGTQDANTVKTYSATDDILLSYVGDIVKRMNDVVNAHKQQTYLQKDVKVDSIWLTTPGSFNPDIRREYAKAFARHGVTIKQFYTETAGSCLAYHALKSDLPPNVPVLCVSSGDLTEDITAIMLDGNQMRVLIPSDGIYSNSGGRGRRMSIMRGLSDVLARDRILADNQMLFGLSGSIAPSAKSCVFDLEKKLVPYLSTIRENDVTTLEIILPQSCKPLCRDPANCRYQPSIDLVRGWVQPLYAALRERVLPVAQRLKTAYNMTQLPVVVMGGGGALDFGLREALAGSDEATKLTLRMVTDTEVATLRKEVAIGIARLSCDLSLENDYAPAISTARSLIGWGKLSDTFIISPYMQLTTQFEASALVVRPVTVNPLRLVVMGQLLQPDETTDLKRKDAWISMNGEQEHQWEVVPGDVLRFNVEFLDRMRQIRVTARLCRRPAPGMAAVDCELSVQRTKDVPAGTGILPAPYSITDQIQHRDEYENNVRAWENFACAYALQHDRTRSRNNTRSDEFTGAVAPPLPFAQDTATPSSAVRAEMCRDWMYFTGEPSPLRNAALRLFKWLSPTPTPTPVLLESPPQQPAAAAAAAGGASAHTHDEL